MVPGHMFGDVVRLRRSSALQEPPDTIRGMGLSPLLTSGHGSGDRSRCGLDNPLKPA